MGNVYLWQQSTDLQIFHIVALKFKICSNSEINVARIVTSRVASSQRRVIKAKFYHCALILRRLNQCDRLLIMNRGPGKNLFAHNSFLICTNLHESLVFQDGIASRFRVCRQEQCKSFSKNARKVSKILYVQKFIYSGIVQLCFAPLRLSQSRPTGQATFCPELRKNIL